VLYAEQGIQKRDLALYYAEIAPWMLPHLRGRLLTLLRCPEGQGKACFYQRHPRQGLPETVRRTTIREHGKPFASMYVEDVEGLLGLVQAGALEIHTWGSRLDRLEQPDQLVFDLDQAPDVDWSAVVEAAHTVRAGLAALGLHGFVKTSGGKGLHVVAPIAPRMAWDEVKQFSKAFAVGMVRAAPERYVATATKTKRAGKIFVDYLRNGRGATAVCAYSTRARPEAPVSMPVAWDELTKALRPDRFVMRDATRYLAQRAHDPWRDFESARAAIGAAARRAVGMR
jgi:bifunctional non-homologous end joining protein LigD